MKSIIEEASSIAKAIEKGWIRAGKPQEFSVKVFEEAQKNFFGFTKKSAKVGLFFQEVYTTSVKSFKERAGAKKSFTAPSPAPKQSQQGKFVKAAAPEKHFNRSPETSPWSDELIEHATQWIRDSLAILNLSHVDIKVEPAHFALKFIFNKPLSSSTEKEKMLFRAWSYLVMQMLRQKFKRPLKGLKIIFMSHA